MLRFVVRRLLLLVPILVGLSILVFLWIRALPGSPATALLGERATAEAIAAINEQYGLNKPLHVQYFAYVEIIGEQEARFLKSDGSGTELWTAYRGVSEKWRNFAMKRIARAADIYPVFRELFARKAEARSDA